jgi:hypothetical protein
MMARNSLRQSGPISTMPMSLVSSCTRSLPIFTVRPSILRRRSSRSSATRSITPRSSASPADRLAASRTAASAQVALRLRSWARLRMKATASLVALRSCASAGSIFGAPLSDLTASSPDFPSEPGSFSGSAGCCGSPGIGVPPIWTGVAAPTFVPGAIAATWVA